MEAANWQHAVCPLDVRCHTQRDDVGIPGTGYEIVDTDKAAQMCYKCCSLQASVRALR